MPIHSLSKQSRGLSLTGIFLFFALAATPVQSLFAEDAPATASQDDHDFLNQVEKKAALNDSQPVPAQPIPGVEKEPPAGAPTPAFRETPPAAPSNLEQTKAQETAAAERKENELKLRKAQARHKDEERDAKTLKREVHTGIAKGNSPPEPALNGTEGLVETRNQFIPPDTMVTIVTTQSRGADGRIYITTKKTTTTGQRATRPEGHVVLKPFFEAFEARN